MTEENGLDLLELPYILYKCIVRTVPLLSRVTPTVVSCADSARATSTGQLAVNGLGYKGSRMQRSV